MSSQQPVAAGPRAHLAALLKSLSRPGACARQDGDRLAISGTHASARGSRRPLPASALAEAVSEGLVARGPDGGSYVLAAAGAKWLRRALAISDPFRTQHQERSLRPADATSPDGRQLLVDDAESPLAWLRRRKDKSGAAMISDEQFTAGERLRSDFWFAQMTPRTTANWSAASSPSGDRRSAPGFGVALRDDVIAAKERVRRALAAVGPELAGVLIDVCCHLQGIETAEETQGWPQRSGKVVLQLALTRLARHYGLIAPEPPAGDRVGAILHWGASDYRPGTEKWK